MAQQTAQGDVKSLWEISSTVARQRLKMSVDRLCELPGPIVSELALSLHWKDLIALEDAGKSMCWTEAAWKRQYEMMPCYKGKRGQQCCLYSQHDHDQQETLSFRDRWFSACLANHIAQPLTRLNNADALVVARQVKRMVVRLAGLQRLLNNPLLLNTLTTNLTSVKVDGSTDSDSWIRGLQLLLSGTQPLRSLEVNLPYNSPNPLLLLFITSGVAQCPQCLQHMRTFTQHLTSRFRQSIRECKEEKERERIRVRIRGRIRDCLSRLVGEMVGSSQRPGQRTQPTSSVAHTQSSSNVAHTHSSSSVAHSHSSSNVAHTHSSSSVTHTQSSSNVAHTHSSSSVAHTQQSCALHTQSSSKVGSSPNEGCAEKQDSGQQGREQTDPEKQRQEEEKSGDSVKELTLSVKRTHEKDKESGDVSVKHKRQKKNEELNDDDDLLVEKPQRPGGNEAQDVKQNWCDDGDTQDRCDDGDTQDQRDDGSEQDLWHDDNEQDLWDHDDEQDLCDDGDEQDLWDECLAPLEQKKVKAPSEHSAGVDLSAWLETTHDQCDFALTTDWATKDLEEGGGVELSPALKELYELVVPPDPQPSHTLHFLVCVVRTFVDSWMGHDLADRLVDSWMSKHLTDKIVDSWAQPYLHDRIWTTEHPRMAPDPLGHRLWESHLTDTRQSGDVIGDRVLNGGMLAHFTQMFVGGWPTAYRPNKSWMKRVNGPCSLTGCGANTSFQSPDLDDRMIWALCKLHRQEGHACLGTQHFSVSGGWQNSLENTWTSSRPRPYMTMTPSKALEVVLPCWSSLKSLSVELDISDIDCEDFLDMAVKRIREGGLQSLSLTCVGIVLYEDHMIDFINSALEALYHSDSESKEPMRLLKVVKEFHSHLEVIPLSMDERAERELARAEAKAKAAWMEDISGQSFLGGETSASNSRQENSLPGESRPCLGLQALCVEGFVVRFMPASPVTEFLEKNSHLRHLTLHRCHMDSLSLTNLLKALNTADKQRLSCVDLNKSYIELSDEQWKLVCALVSKPSITSFSITEFKLTAKHVTDQDFVRAVRSHGESRKLALDLSMNNLVDGLWDFLDEAVSPDSALKVLTMKYTHCTEERGAMVVAGIIERYRDYLPLLQEMKWSVKYDHSCMSQLCVGLSRLSASVSHEVSYTADFIAMM